MSNRTYWMMLAAEALCWISFAIVALVLATEIFQAVFG